MTIAELEKSGRVTMARDAVGSARAPSHQPRDLQRTFQLLLATLWLLDAVLQIQPYMFTAGPHGFSAMLHGAASGNPGWVAGAITWNASLVNHYPVLTNTLFASIQFVIGFGIVSARTRKAALGLSIVWSICVWWFGEGLGGVLVGRATPFGGGPGAALFYALLAVLLWPHEGSDRPFVAARAVGVKAARALWVLAWAALALLSVVGSGRSPQALHELVSGINGGQPRWLAHIDRASESLFLRDGTTMAVLLSVVCLTAAAGVFLPRRFTQATLVLAIVVFVAIWIAAENFGGTLAGGATDPNSGLPIVLLALIYWPLANRPTKGSDPPTVLISAEVA
ncbi:MAG: hypothetical protein ACLQRH_19435 [Acidimicrobiales bacterium]